MCSAGVGRTGTFITIDHVLEQVGKENVVDIPGVINKIRHQRMKLVQTVVSVYLLRTPTKEQLEILIKILSVSCTFSVNGKMKRLCFPDS